MNGKINDLNCKYVLIGTEEISSWTEGKPFMVFLNTEYDFESNGLTKSDFEDMKVSEVRTDLDDYKGTMIIRIS